MMQGGLARLVPMQRMAIQARGVARRGPGRSLCPLPVPHCLHPTGPSAPTLPLPWPTSLLHGQHPVRGGSIWANSGSGTSRCMWPM